MMLEIKMVVRKQMEICHVKDWIVCREFGQPKVTAHPEVLKGEKVGEWPKAMESLNATIFEWEYSSAL